MDEHVCLGSRISNKITGIKIPLTFLSILVAAVPLLLTLPVEAQSLNFTSTQRNCDNNAVINCGAMSVSELQTKYASDPTIADIFNCFNITAADINSIGSDVQAGTVTRSGDVIVNGQTVAINATTAGRQYMPGSTTQDCNGTTIYERPPSVSFLSDQLDAFVVMTNGRFDYAILTSCGNPVEAAPTTQAAAPAAPAPTTPAPTPTPAPAQPAAVAPPKTLVNTGPGEVFIVFLLTTLAAALLHYRYKGWLRKLINKR